MELALFKPRGFSVAVLAAVMCFLGNAKLHAQDVGGVVLPVENADDPNDTDISDPPGSEEEGDSEPSEDNEGDPEFTGVELPEVAAGDLDGPSGSPAHDSPVTDFSSVSGALAVKEGTSSGQNLPPSAGISPAPGREPSSDFEDRAVPDAAAGPQSSDVQALDEEKHGEEHEFLGLTLAPEVGYVFFPKSELTVNGFKATVQARNGFVAKVHLDLGGDGIAFELAPLFAVEAGGIDAKGGDFGTVAVDLDQGFGAGSFQAVGGQMGLVWRFRAGRFYPGFGLGFHGAYLMGDAIDYGLELYGRVPVGFTVYLAPRLGLVVEAGFMLGVTGIRTPLDWSSLEAAGLSEQAVADAKQISSEAELREWLNQYQSELDPSAAEQYQGIDADTAAQDIIMNQLADSLRFGVGFGIDLMVGLRFP